VIFIGILDFVFFEDDDDYITRHRTVNVKTQKSTLNGMEYNFIELPKFIKELKDIKTLVDKWIYFIKNSENLDVIPAGLKDEGLIHAYEDADRHNWTKEELEAYHYAEMRRQDEKGKTTVAIRKAVEQEKIDNIKKLYEKGVSIDIIAYSNNMKIEQAKQILNINN